MVLNREWIPVNRLITLSVMGLIAVATAGCHEARVTGPTQCFAPHATHAVTASAIVKAPADLTPTAAVARAATGSESTTL